MRDCRTILERFYEEHGKRTNFEWLLKLDEIEMEVPEVQLTEKRLCKLILDIRRFLLTNKRKILHTEIRRMMHGILEHGYEDYICEIQDLPTLLEIFESEESDGFTLAEVLSDIKKIFKYCYYSEC